jgi:hypothetical protein
VVDEEQEEAEEEEDDDDDDDGEEIGILMHGNEDVTDIFSLYTDTVLIFTLAHLVLVLDYVGYQNYRN